MNFDPDQTVKKAINQHESYCDGYSANSRYDGGYILGIVLEAINTKSQLSHRGSSMLDDINAFDMSEVEGTYIGQINMITVSSYCGLQGVIWGLDVVKHKYLRKINIQHNGPIEAYEIDPLLHATKSLIGTVNKKRFQIIPGAHVPCAGKNISMTGPAYAFSAVAIGVPENRSKNACLLMEDIGNIKNTLKSTKKINELHDEIKEKIIDSVIQVGRNHNIKYKEVFVGVKGVNIYKGEIGNALVAAPYMTLPKNAIPKGGKLSNMTLNEWENSIKDKFLYKNKNG